MLQKELQKAGLTDKEAKVYLAVLEIGNANIARITQRSKVKRATVYLAVESLKEKGLLSVVKKGAKTFFNAEDPRNIQKQLKEKEEAISKVMPELLGLFSFLDKRPNIRYFEGGNGIKEVLRDILNYPNQEVLTWYAEQYKEFDEKFFLDYFIPERKKNKIWVRSIFPDTSEMRELYRDNPDHLRQSRFVANDKFNLKIEIVIYGKNKVGIISFKEEIGLIIESEDIHASIKSIFEVMWDSLV